MKSAILSTLLLLHCFLNSAAQPAPYQFSRLDIRNGLSNNRVNCIFQDRKGFLWFGTAAGLNRYDGFTFKVFSAIKGDTTSLAGNSVQNIFELPGGKLWISSLNSVSVYDPVTETFNRNYRQYLSSLKIPAINILSIRKDKRQRFLFLSGQSTLYEYDHATKATRQLPVYHPAGYTQDAGITGMAVDAANCIWLVHKSGFIQQLDSTHRRTVFSTAALQNANAGELLPYELFIDSDNDLWINAGKTKPKGLFCYSPATGRLLHFKKNGAYPLNADMITGGIAEDPYKKIWVGTDHGGINVIDKKDLSVHYLLHAEEDERSLSLNSIYALFRDNREVMWVGTYKTGINYFNGHRSSFPLYRHHIGNRHSLPFEDVNRFLEDDKGNIWLGTNGGGLVYFDRVANRFTTYRHDPADPNSLSADVIVSLCMDHEQQLWIGTYLGGLDCFDGKKFIHYRHDPDNSSSLADESVWEIYEDSRHNLWIGTLAAGLDRFDREKGIFYHFSPDAPLSVHGERIDAIMEDREGNIWVGTDNGIDVLEKRSGRFINYSYTDNDGGSFSNSNINYILQDSRGLVWIGSNEGLHLFDKEKNSFHVFKKNDGLPDNNVLTIVEDNDHHLWMSTPNGLSKMEVAQAAGDEPLRYSFVNFDESGGLQGRDFNPNAALKLRSGELLFGGPHGFNLFHPNNIRQRQQAPRVILTGLQVFNQPLAAGEQLHGRVVLQKAMPETDAITLRYNENVFSIDFAALDYAFAAKERYAYKLEGFNNVWLTADGHQRKATFTNLDPGRYTFRVRVANGLTPYPETRLQITILPSWWRTPLAYAIYFLLIIAALLFARQLIIQRAKMRFLILHQQREARRMHELDMMKIRFFTNVSHEFRTPLALIMAPVEKMMKAVQDTDQKKHLQLVHRNAKRLLNLVNQLLDFRKLETEEIYLQPTEDDIINFTRHTVGSFSDIAEKKQVQLSFSATVDSFITSFDRVKLERILFNLLSNAFKFTPEHGSISVTVTDSPDHIAIAVADTGIGIPAEKKERIFERFFQYTDNVPGGMAAQGSGIGLAITREFVRLHGGSIAVESEPGKGSCFTVYLPLSPAAAPRRVPALNGHHTEAAPVNGHTASTEKREQDGKRSTILLIDDNEDFRFYLKDNLRAHFNIVEAGNGKEGWQRTLGQHPDLVVSDIMMPEMNGIELCRKIRSDERTAGIPVILLTARSAEEIQLEGFSTGASDFITKPFNFEILLSRISNLLAQQENMIRTYRRQVEVVPGNVTVVTEDETLITRASEVIQQNLDNPDFSVEHLSKALLVSRAALYKKITAITGQTPVELIRSIRIRHAAQLLEKSRMTVSEIAYAVGFNNTKYFVKYFKEAYYMLPTEYRASRK
ncbi:hybrid sensor histidine kinase/response regulator transcription factor [Chitinophaga japonensis]|uniref:histidine kinase n=1 Tax=Chitinophaga japonensis TaxID=104662 RepID=A0A562T636_CHIJA|nr:two-component regulator propeller domain-containing protein [Chitinophaga japonensis]TWI88714.1 signal transduction histidine kinase [Chitinophaga japonensis]